MTEFICVLLGGGVLGFIQFLITRRDKKQDDKKQDAHKEIMDAFKSLEAKFSELEKNTEERDIKTCRSRILRFNDELINNVDHTHELFLDVIDDIKIYEKYCEEHKSFKNGRTEQSCENIRNVYDHLFRTGKFGHGGERHE